MDQVIRLILDQVGVMGAFIVALGSYLVKKELSFQKERAEFLTLLERKSDHLLNMFERNMTTQAALEKEIALLRNEILLSMDIRDRRHAANADQS